VEEGRESVVGITFAEHSESRRFFRTNKNPIAAACGTVRQCWWSHALVVGFRVQIRRLFSSYV